MTSSRCCSSAAPIRTRRNTFGGTPLASAAHGSFHSPGPIAGGGTDHRRIAERLVATGAKVEPDMTHEAAPELAEWLAERRAVSDTPSSAGPCRRSG